MQGSTAGVCRMCDVEQELIAFEWSTWENIEVQCG